MIEIVTSFGRLSIAADRINAVELRNFWLRSSYKQVKIVTMWRTYYFSLPTAEAEDLYKQITETYSKFLLGYKGIVDDNADDNLS